MTGVRGIRLDTSAGVLIVRGPTKPPAPEVPMVHNCRVAKSSVCTNSGFAIDREIGVFTIDLPYCLDTVAWAGVDTFLQHVADVCESLLVP